MLILFVSNFDGGGEITGLGFIQLDCLVSRGLKSARYDVKGMLSDYGERRGCQWQTCSPTASLISCQWSVCCWTELSKPREIQPMSSLRLRLRLLTTEMRSVTSANWKSVTWNEKVSSQVGPSWPFLTVVLARPISWPVCVKRRS